MQGLLPFPWGGFLSDDRGGLGYEAPPIVRPEYVCGGVPKTLEPCMAGLAIALTFSLHLKITY